MHDMLSWRKTIAVYDQVDGVKWRKFGDFLIEGRASVSGARTTGSKNLNRETTDQ
jgi:hypothetical protein